MGGITAVNSATLVIKSHVHTGDQQQFLSFGLLQRASSMLLVRAAAQSLQGLVHHRLQLPCFFIKSLDSRPTQGTKDKHVDLNAQKARTPTVSQCETRIHPDHQKQIQPGRTVSTIKLFTAAEMKKESHIPQFSFQ